MILLKKIPQEDMHQSQRGYFAGALYNTMIEDPNIVVLTGDLGYGVLDKIRSDFPDRFINTRAAETSMMNIAVGLAMEGRIPVVYSITTFLLYRPFEVIRNFIDHEGWPVKMVGSGRDKDYAHDGFSHWSEDAYDLFDKEHSPIFNNICSDWPQTKEEIPELMKEFLYCAAPHFLSLRR